MLTYEAPIEFVYDMVQMPNSIMSQSEIPRHLPTFADGVRNALRRKPRLILVGEARDRAAVALQRPAAQILRRAAEVADLHVLDYQRPVEAILMS